NRTAPPGNSPRATPPPCPRSRLLSGGEGGASESGLLHTVANRGIRVVGIIRDCLQRATQPIHHPTLGRGGSGGEQPSIFGECSAVQLLSAESHTIRLVYPRTRVKHLERGIRHHRRGGLAGACSVECDARTDQRVRLRVIASVSRIVGCVVHHHQRIGHRPIALGRLRGVRQRCTRASIKRAIGTL